MKILKPPTPVPLDSSWKIFLAGSIEMGKAVDWQARVSKSLESISDTESEVAVCNPRRDDWDSSWVQSIDNPKFLEQVEWELNALERSSVIAMHFEPDTKSPITLLELGLFARESTHRLFVHCPEGFWRKGNVDIVCKRYNVKMVPTIDDLVAEVLEVTRKYA